MKPIVLLVIVALLITKLSDQEIDSGTGAGTARRPVNVKEREWVSLDLTDDEINSRTHSLDTTYPTTGHNHVDLADSSQSALGKIPNFSKVAIH